MTDKDNDPNFIKRFNYSAQEIICELLSLDITRPLVRGDLVTDINGSDYIVIGLPTTIEDPTPPIVSADPAEVMGGWSRGPNVWDRVKQQQNYIQPGFDVPVSTHRHIPVEKMLIVLPIKLKRGQDGSYEITSVGHMQLFANVDSVKLAFYI